MITPDDRVPQDDLQGEDKDDQMSQQDIHSNGFDESDKPMYDNDNQDESDALAQAYEAAESAHTLDYDDDDLDEDND
ncbi:MAG: hypothetical protein ACTHNW_13040 [Mucilaginibacter sp.]